MNDFINKKILTIVCFFAVLTIGAVDQKNTDILKSQEEINKSSQILEFQPINGFCYQGLLKINFGEKNRQIMYVDCAPEAYGYNQDETFYSGTLELMDIPVTQFAIDVFLVWEPYENTAACWNPLATTYRVDWMPIGTGCTESIFNSAGVRNYSSKYCGQLATARTLLYSGSGTYYKAIRELLAQESFDWQALYESIKKWVGSDSYAQSITNKRLELWNNRDRTPPETTHSFLSTSGDNGWYVDDVLVTLNAYDDLSGVSYTQYNIDNTSLLNYSGAFLIEFSGVYTLNYRSVDLAGNVEKTKSTSIKIDKDIPQNPTIIDPGCNIDSDTWQIDCFDPNFSWDGASDLTSGVDSYQYYWGLSSNGTSSEILITPKFNPSPVSEGTYYLRLRTRDKAGSFSNWKTLFIFRFGLDPDAPHHHIYFPMTIIKKNNLFIKNSGFENGSDGSWLEYSSNYYPLIYNIPSSSHTGNWFAWLGGGYNEVSRLSQTFSVPDNKPYLHFWVYVTPHADSSMDFFHVYLNNLVVHHRDLAELDNLNEWNRVVINLEDYQGKIVDLMFEVTTTTTSYSSVFLDDLVLSPY